MVFLGGPRQVGKTTLGLEILGGDEEHPGYLNWDLLETKQMLVKGNIPTQEKILLFDEIHKWPGWRDFLKGVYDRYKNKISFIVTGSARLDYFRKGGDSLQGRYFFYRLHPVSLMEMNSDPNTKDMELLLKFGGFPKPLLSGEERYWKRWQRERAKRVIQEDLINLEKVKEISLLEILVALLPEKVGSQFSINSIREDLSGAYETIDRWINILENLFYCFRISPYTAKKIAAIKKEKKLYLWDWSLCLNKGARFENMVASHLLKYCHFVEDTEGDDMELRFLRDKNQREIDFVILKNNKPIFAVECKSGEKNISKHIRYFSKSTEIPFFYQVHTKTKEFENIECRTRVLPFNKFCKALNIP